VAQTPELVPLAGGGRTVVYRSADVVIRETGPWAPSVHALLRHLESVGFSAAPRLVGTGFDEAGRETLTYIEGEFIDPGPWSLAGVSAVGGLLRELHKASAAFVPPPDAIWSRSGFFDLMVEFAICDTAAEADDAGVTPELTSHPIALWAMAWRARSAAWMIRNRQVLEHAITHLPGA
jgi:hypothetical protein